MIDQNFMEMFEVAKKLEKIHYIRLNKLRKWETLTQLVTNVKGLIASPFGVIGAIWRNFPTQAISNHICFCSSCTL